MRRIAPHLLILATLATLGAMPASARDLGRLFYTPEQRAALERNRFAPPPKEAPKPEPRVETAPPADVALNGIVTRSSGRSTTWVNGVARHDAGPAETTTSRVAVDDRRRAVTLKVGETFDPASGRRRDVLGGGSVQVKRGD